MREVPTWAINLLNRIATDENKSRSPLPAIKWRQSKSKWHGSGHFLPDWGINPRIIITVGKSGKSHARTILVHEIAHWFTLGARHSNRFQDVNYRLQRKYGSIKIESKYYRHGSGILRAKRRARQARKLSAK